MKKYLKKILMVTFILFIVFFVVNVFADTKNVIKEYVDYSDMTAVLYEDGQLYVWATGNNDKHLKTVVENVRDISEFSYESIVGVLDNDNNLRFVYTDYLYNSELDLWEDTLVVTDVVDSNIKEIDNFHILTNNNELYDYSYGAYSEPQYSKKLIMNDVKEWVYNRNNGSYLLLDLNDDLFAYGTNIFGKKINDGENIVLSPVLIARDVREFSCLSSRYYDYDDEIIYGNFYITNNNELYVMSTELPYPKLLKENVSKFLQNKYYISDGKTYEISYQIKDDLINITKDEKVLDIEIKKMIYWTDEFGSFFHAEDGNIYDYNNEVVLGNVKQVSNDNYSYILLEDGTLFTYKMEYVYSPDDEDGSSYHYVLRKDKLLGNVKSIIDVDTLIMNDETLYVKNFCKNDYNGSENLCYKNFAIIKGLPNVPENVAVSQIVLRTNNKTDFVEGNTDDFYAEIYPYNATDKEVLWESSDESVATVDEKGTMSFNAAGNTTINVKGKNSNLHDEVSIIVHPKNTGIEIIGDDEITINKNEELLFKVKITPDNVLEQKIKWTSNAEDKNDISFYGINEEYYSCFYETCPKSYDEVLVVAHKAGKYTLTATTEDGLYSDSITLNVIQGITDLGISPNRENVLGQTLYMYMKESNTLELNPKIYPSDATDKELEYTSSDESIATVDNNGKVTAKKGGKVKITIKAKNFDVKYEINILIFDENITTKIGDVDGDGFVDILDLVKLRRHVAGVEAIE